MISLFINNSPSSGKIINSTGNQVTISFNPPILLDDSKKYQMRLLSANIVYCQPSVTSKNNTLQYTTSDSVVHTMTFDDGLYSLNDINTSISLFTEATNNGNDNSLITFIGDESTSKVYCVFDQPNISINCACANSIMPMIGFPASSGVIGNLSTVSYVKSPLPATLNTIQQYLIQCDITNGSYNNANSTNIICAITPNVSPYSTIIYTPYHPIRVNVNVARIDQMTLTLVDQNNNPVDMGTSEGINSPELWSVVLAIERIDMAGLL